MNKYQSKKKYLFILLILTSILFRFICLFYYGDRNIENEWNILFYNFKNYKIISFYVFDGINVSSKIASAGELPLPSVFMPPFYIFFIILVNFFIKESYLVLTILFIQILLSLITPLIFYNLLKNFFDKQISQLGMFILMLFPIYIYSSSQISSVNFQIFFLVIFFYLIFKLIKKKTFLISLSFSTICSALLMLRGEFILVLVLSYIFIYLRIKNLKLVFLIFLSSLILLTPYLKRNLNTFGEITITKSIGFNLWKGNNLYSNSEGNEYLYDNEMIEKIKKIKPNNRYEILKDKLYKKEAIKNILSDPFFYFILYLKKIFTFLFFDLKSSYPNYYNIFHIIPKIILSITTIMGAYFSVIKQKKLIYFNLIFFLNIFLFSAFFILPRYSLALLPLQIILSCNFFSVILKKSFRN